jgi:hypothetical protein
LDFPFPILNEQQVIRLDNAPDDCRFPRISSQASSLPFIRGMTAIQHRLGCDWPSFSHYFMDMYQRMFGSAFPPVLSPRELWYVKRYLSQFVKLFLKSYPDVSDSALANFVLLLTLSSCYVYPFLEPHHYGFSLIVMTDLFCPARQHRPTFVTTLPLNALFPDSALQELSNIDIPGLRREHVDPKKDISLIDLWRDIFSSSDIYIEAFQDLVSEERSAYDSTHDFDAAEIFRQTIVTWSYFYRLVLLTSRIFLRQSVILEGETGCGKTSMVHFIRAALSLPWNEDGHALSHVLADALNFHGGVGRAEFLHYLEEIKTSSRPTIAFCDEINTSMDCSFVEQRMLNEVPGLKPRICIIAAVNLLAPLTMASSFRVGMEQLLPERVRTCTLQEQSQPERTLARQRSRYNVHALQSMSSYLSVNCNPRRLTGEEWELYPLEEEKSVARMIGSLKTLDQGYLNALTEAVHQCVRFTRNETKERAVISYRDISRVCPIFNHVAQTLNQLANTDETSSPNRTRSVFLTSSVVSLMMCFCLRLRESLRAKLVGNLEGTFRTFQLNVEFERVFREFAFYYNWKIMPDREIWKFTSTMVHLLVIRICVECCIPCFIVGMPGTSKSFAVELLEGPSLNDPNRPYRVHKYVSSKTSSPDGIKSQFFDAVFRSVTEPNLHPIVFIDEMGLANLNPAQPLKFLHGILDHGIAAYGRRNLRKIATIGVSNYELDFANMNRAIVVCTELPHPDELVTVFGHQLLPCGMIWETLPTPADDAQRLPYDAIYPTYFTQRYGEFSKFWQDESHRAKIGPQACLDRLWKQQGKMVPPEIVALRSLYAAIPLVTGKNLSENDFVSLVFEIINAKRLVKPGQTDPNALRQLPTIARGVLLQGDAQFRDVTSNWTAFGKRSALSEQSVDPDQNMFRKGLCVLTVRYEAVDFVRQLPGLKEPILLFAEDFKEALSTVSFHGLEVIQRALSSNPDQPIVLIGNHPVLDSILDILNAPRIGNSILIGSGFTTMITVTHYIKILLIAELEELYDVRNPFSLPFLDQTHTTFLDWIEICPVLYQSVQADWVVHLLDIHQRWADEDGFSSGPLHTNIPVLLEKGAEAWLGHGSEIPTKCPLDEKEQFQNKSVAGILASEWQQSVHVVIKTRAGIHAKLSLPGNECPSLEIDDSEIQSSKVLREKITAFTEGLVPTGKSLVIVKCSRFDALHHAHLKSLLDGRGSFHAVIIYFNVNSRIPSTVRWPVLAMEDISEYPALQAAVGETPLSYKCVHNLYVELSETASSPVSDKRDPRATLVSQIWKGIRDLWIGRDLPSEPADTDDLFPWRLTRFHLILPYVTLITGTPRGNARGLRLLRFLGTTLSETLSCLQTGGGSLHSRLVGAIVTVFETRLFPIVRTLPTSSSEAFNGEHRIIAAVVAYLATLSDLTLYALPSTKAESSVNIMGVGFDLPYRGPLIDSYPFFHFFLRFAHRLIHNHVLKYDQDELLARTVLLYTDSRTLHYIQNVRKDLLKLLVGDDTFAMPGDSVGETDGLTLESQLFLFRTFAGIDYSDTLALLFSKKVDIAYETSTFWGKECPLSFWRWYFIVEVVHAYHGHPLFADTTVTRNGYLDPALLFGFTVSTSPIRNFQERLVQANIDGDYANARSLITELLPSDWDDLTLQLAHLEIAAQSIRRDVPHPSCTEAWHHIGDIPTAPWTCADMLKLFNDVHPTAPGDMDNFECNGCLITDIFNAFCYANAVLRTDAASFRAWFLSPRDSSLLALQIVRLLVTREPRHFNNILHLLDPYHSPPEWQHAFFLLTRLEKQLRDAKMTTPTVQDIDALFNSTCSIIIECFRRPHFFDGGCLRHASFSNWLFGVAHRIWSWTLNSPDPRLLALLRWFDVLAEFHFIDSLVRLLWLVRHKFGRDPALFGAVLSCCSLFPGASLPVLQQLPFAAAKGFNSLTIPVSLTSAATAYQEIPALIQCFLVRYHPIVDALAALGWSVEHRSPSELIPNSFISCESLRAMFGAMAVSAADGDSITECLAKTILAHDIPICKFDVDVEKPFFGYTDGDWKDAFATVPRFWKWQDGIWRAPSREWRSYRRADTGPARPETLLICIAWIYASTEEFPLEDFCTNAPLTEFLIQDGPAVTFAAAPELGAGPLGRFIPEEFKKLLFEEHVGQ